MATSVGEALTCASDPFRRLGDFIEGTQTPRFGSPPGSLLGTIAIGAFHVQHLVLYGYAGLLTTDDLWHHLINALAVPLAGIFLPFGRATAITTLSISGLPGGIVYVLLYLERLGLVSRETYLHYNGYINLTVRLPLQFIATAYGLIHYFREDYSPIAGNVLIKNVMLAAGIVQLANVVYFCRETVGTDFASKLRAREAAKAKFGQRAEQPVEGDE